MPTRRNAMVWRRGTARRAEFERLAEALRDILAERDAKRQREGRG